MVIAAILRDTSQHREKYLVIGDLESHGGRQPGFAAGFVIRDCRVSLICHDFLCASGACLPAPEDRTAHIQHVKGKLSEWELYFVLLTSAFTCLLGVGCSLRTTAARR